MLQFRRYGPDRFNPEKHYGICFEWHPKRKGVDLFWGKYIYAFWIGRTY